MFSSSTLGVLLGTILVISLIPNASSYTKYGRTCKDIGCRRDEVCVMAEDPCSFHDRDNCGRYPTCSKAHPGEASCASTVCGENEYCKTENGMPTCVKKSTGIGYESAGVSYVNGQRTKPDDKTSNSASNSNPYANANAPPAPADPAGGYRQVNSGNNLGYPAYPGNTGSNAGSNSGYPPYPPSNNGHRQQDLGYPPYPTHNRMPMPGYPPQNYPSYSGQPGAYPAVPGYPAAPGYPQQYPGQQNYPYSNYPNQNRMHHDNVYSIYRRNNAVVQSASLITVCLTSLVMLAANKS